MKIHEYQAKELLAAAGAAIPRGKVARTPDEHRQMARRVKPGDLVVLHTREAPRVRVVLDVRPGSDGGKVVMLAPDATDGERSFLASRVVTLPWDMGTTVAAVAS